MTNSTFHSYRVQTTDTGVKGEAKRNIKPQNRASKNIPVFGKSKNKHLNITARL